MVSEVTISTPTPRTLILTERVAHFTKGAIRLYEIGFQC
jgi:hypothetical protein